MECKGVVQGNVVVLDEGRQLPDGVRVTVTMDQTGVMSSGDTPSDDLKEQRTWEAQSQAFGRRLTGRHVDLGNLVLEGREALEERVQPRYRCQRCYQMLQSRRRPRGSSRSHSW